MRLIIEPHYFPCIEYVAALLEADQLSLEVNEFYIKQTYRNRCYIKTANQIDRLSVPIQNTHKGTKFKDVRVDYSQRWQKVHWGAIFSAYGNAPFYEHLKDEIHAIIFKKHEFLLDLNIETLTLCLNFLRHHIYIDTTSVFQASYENDIQDLRNQFVPDNQSTTYMYPTYQQIFGNEFVKNLSIIDLLFCMGNYSLPYLKEIGNFKVLNF
ncbi:MAG: WbqC family protein [Thermoflexibacter sp.]|jgi:hypothetical protein|nr:WbqC family protein [Thermoflexibacter sp.]